MRVLVSTAFASLVFSLPLQAETHVETINENRLNLFFTLPEDEAQALLPAHWSLTPLPGGPAAGANALVVMIDRVSAVDADRQPLEANENRLAVLVIFGQDAAAGEGGPVVVAGWSDAAAAAPGAYGNYKDAEVTFACSGSPHWRPPCPFRTALRARCGPPERQQRTWPGLPDRMRSSGAFAGD